MTSEVEFLRSVVDEHLDEAEFAYERLESLQSGAEATLASVAKWPEEPLIAHVDALVVGGEAVANEVLRPALEAKKPPAAARVVVLVMALLGGARRDLAVAALGHASPEVRRGAVRGCALAGDAGLDSWVTANLPAVGASPLRDSLLELAVERGLAIDAPGVGEALRSEASEALLPALRASWRGDPMAYEGRVIALMDHPEPAVRDAAIVAGLHHGSLHAWARCQHLAFGAEPHPLAMTLVAGLGDGTHHGHLASLVDSPEHRAAAIRALGFAGNVAHVPRLVSLLGSEDVRAAKLAGEALSTIVGREVEGLVPPPEKPAARGPGLRPPEEDEEARRALPAFEEDDLDADLVPGPEAPLATLDATAVAAWWSRAASRFDVNRRWVGGGAVTPTGVAEALRAFPMRRRHLLALLLSIRSAGAARVSVRALTAVQRRQLADVAARGEERWARGFGYFG